MVPKGPPRNKKPRKADTSGGDGNTGPGALHSPKLIVEEVGQLNVKIAATNIDLFSASRLP